MKAGFRSKDTFVFFMLYRYSASRIQEYFKKNVGKQEFLKKKNKEEDRRRESESSTKWNVRAKN